jgi:polyferredoxin
MKERLRKQKRARLLRAVIQILFLIVAPSLFSTAFAGIKSIFLSLGAGQSITWNSFLNITAALLLVTCLFGRHFCGYACAFGTLGDFLYEITDWILQKIFHKKKRHGYSEKTVHALQKVKYLVLGFLLLSCITGIYQRLSGCSPWDVFSMLTAHKLPGPNYWIGIILLVLIMVGMCTQERFFCQFLCPMGAVFAMMPVFPGALFRRRRENCGKNCTLCKKRCPAHLEIDGDTYMSGECICCHACLTTCPRGNIQIGNTDPMQQDNENNKDKKAQKIA